MTKVLKQGAGWRMGIDPAQEAYPYLVGGDDWAVELTALEFADFQRLVGELTQTLVQLAQELMPEETIHCELESEHLWLEVAGYPHAYELRFILHTQRRAEGRWPAPVVKELLVALMQKDTF